MHELFVIAVPTRQSTSAARPAATLAAACCSSLRICTRWRGDEVARGEGRVEERARVCVQRAVVAGAVGGAGLRRAPRRGGRGTHQTPSRRLTPAGARAAASGQRHPSRPASRRFDPSAGRDTWNLTGEALGGPRKRSWRRCSRARSGRRLAIRGAHSGALDRPEPSDPAARAPIRTGAPCSAADSSGSSWAVTVRNRRAHPPRSPPAPTVGATHSLTPPAPSSPRSTSRAP